MKLGIDDEVTCFISQYFSINAHIATRNSQPAVRPKRSNRRLFLFLRMQFCTLPLRHPLRHF